MRLRGACTCTALYAREVQDVYYRGAPLRRSRYFIHARSNSSSVGFGRESGLRNLIKTPASPMPGLITRGTVDWRRAEQL